MPTRPARTTCTGVLVAALAASAVGVVLAPASRAAEPVVRAPLSAVPEPLWQTDRSVNALAYSSGVLFVGGDFARVRPPGSAPGAPAEVAQAYLAAFRTSDGQLIGSWRPQLTGPGVDGGTVRDLEVSPDGRRLYVGGDFTAVNGVPRSRLAAFDLTGDGAPTLVPPSEFPAGVSGRVFALAATDDRVYVGGGFTSAAGEPRSRAAAFSAGTGQLLPWQVDLQGALEGTTPSVTVLTLARDRVYVGGMFDQVDGVAQHGLAVVDPATGAREPGFTVPRIVGTTTVTSALVADGTLYLAGRDGSPDPRRLEGVMALDADSGALRWGADGRRCLGDTYALVPLAGAVWAGTHAHDCTPVGGHPEISFPGKPVPTFWASTVAHDPQTGTLRHFFPDTNGADAVLGSRANVRALATDGTRLFVGGGWLTVNGVPQQNLNAYSPRTQVRSDAPQEVAPTARFAGSGVEVSWTTSSDRDDRTLVYEVYRGASTTPLRRISRPSVFWRRERMRVVDFTAPRGRTFTYRVVVSDGDNRVPAVSGPVTVPR